MKRILTLSIGLMLLAIGWAHGAPPAWPPGNYVVIGWNDLGIPCINPSYAKLALLPPFAV